MELFQAAALLHDDVMDRSDTRRGQPSAHRAFAALHARAGWAGESERFGESAPRSSPATCACSGATRRTRPAGCPREDLARGRRLFDTMRTQLMGGQYLDLLESARGWDGLDLEARVAAGSQR